jgi:hypothetical protein
MTKRLSEVDKALLKLAREREREEARNARRDQAEREREEVRSAKRVQAERDRERIRFEQLPITE